jgi:citrate lyase beta subunit
MADLSFLRSLLFTPADRPDRFGKACQAGADGAILDLEDGVGLPAKDVARREALAFFASRPSAPDGFIWAVRLNHITTPDGLNDLLAFREASARPPLFLLPKVESAMEITIAAVHLACGGESPIFMPLIESAAGLSAADVIARHPGVGALGFGGADLASDLNAAMAWEPLLFARSRVVQAAACAAIPAADVPFLNIHDMDGLRGETEAAKALGYRCKLAIHPGQIATVNAVFTPTSQEVTRARRILAAFEAAKGNALELDGKMVDAPVVNSARRIVQIAQRADAGRP